MSIQELEAEVRKLKPEDQFRLLHALTEALDDDAAPLTEEELELRWAAFEAGKDAPVEATELRRRALRQHGLA